MPQTVSERAALWSDTFAEIGIDHPASKLAIALDRGWDADRYLDLILDQNEDGITLWHPYNWLEEGEAEREIGG